MIKATGEGSEGPKISNVILKDLVEMKKMLKSASKNIIPRPSYDFLENRDLPVITVRNKTLKLRCPKKLIYVPS